VNELQDELMSIRLREAETQAEIREMKQRMMEMETQVWRAGPGGWNTSLDPSLTQLFSQK
jgi:hypothetical protein